MKKNNLTAKEKATKLLAITFNKIADATNYKGVQNDGGKLFAKLEDIAKKISLDFTDEIIRELKEINGVDIQPRIDFFEEVKIELNKI